MLETNLEVRWLPDFRSVDLFHWLFQVGLGCGLARILGFILWRVGRPKSLSILGRLRLCLLLCDISSHLVYICVFLCVSCKAFYLLLSTAAQTEALCFLHFTEVQRNLQPRATLSNGDGEW